MEARREERRAEWWVNSKHLFRTLILLQSFCPAILTSFNRNFRSRNDGNKDTMNFLASPTVVTAMSFSGKLSFNPTTDSIPLPSGQSFKFVPPVGQDLPSEGFTSGDRSLYPAPNPAPEPDTEIVISPTSTRLEVLKPFDSQFGPHNPRGLELPSLKVLMRVRGKCTTDHISAAVRPNNAVGNQS
jgi:homoaconitase